MRTRLRRRYVATAGLAAALALLAAGTAGAMVGTTNGVGGEPDKAVLTGVPGMSVDGVEDAGAVELRTKNGDQQLLTAPDPSTGARFGQIVHETEIGKLYFNLERFALVGAPGLSVDGKPDAGGIYVFEREQDDVRFVTLLTQADPAIPGEAQAGAQFGASIDSYVRDGAAAGGSDSTLGFIGVPGLDVGDAEQAGGVVEIELGRSSDQPSANIEVRSGQLHTLLSTADGVEPSTGDRLGETVLADGADFFAGAPSATVAELPAAGFVLLAHRDADRADELLYPGTHGIPGQPQVGAEFGAAIDRTTEKLPSDLGRSRGLLAIGSPGYQTNGYGDAGLVYTLTKPPGADAWEFDVEFSQDSQDDGTGRPVGGHAEPGDRFGASVLFASALSKYTKPYLLVGAPGEAVGDVEDAGLVNGLYGLPSQHEGHTGGAVGPDREFGAALSTNTRFHNYWPLDIAYEYLIGIPGAQNGAGGMAFGTGGNNGEIRWHQSWSLYTGDGQPSDGYGTAFDQGEASS